ncbi:MAG: hypothetical protein ABFD92_16605 [Planctomycetaceae bacterium]|nr:hypothetical protein [Planctomycetaceae bacterium]
MAVFTSFGPTPWTTGQLAALHGVNAGLAKRRQQALDEWVVTVLAVPLVARSARADQAACSIAAMVERLAALLDRDRQSVMAHLTRLVKVAYDRQASRTLDDAAKRLPSQSRQISAISRQPSRKVGVA